MAVVYLDFNKTANGDGTWANAYSWVQAGSNTTANCVVANTIASGDEIRIVGRDYFTHSFAANTFFANSTSGTIYVNSSNAIGTSNGAFIWFKDIRPELGSGAWIQRTSGSSNSTHTLIGLDVQSSSYSPVFAMFNAYPSFANATTVYCNSAVLAIDLNTSSLIPIQATNDGVVFTTSAASAHYFLNGLKANTLITDNWTADGVRDTTLNSNNKTIILIANTSPTAASYKYIYLGGAAGDCSNINFDLRNTILGDISGANGNTTIQSAHIRWGLFNQGTSSANTALGISYDIGAITHRLGYASNIPNVYVAVSTTSFRFASASQTENFLRIRSLYPAGYVYYPDIQWSTSLTTSSFSTTRSYNCRIDCLLSEGAYQAATLSVGSISNLRLIYGDIFNNSSSTTSSGVQHSSGGSTYSFRAGWNISSPGTGTNNYIHFDRTRHGSAQSMYANILTGLPIGIGALWSVYPYVSRYNTIRYSANGTIQLANNQFYGGEILSAGSSSYPSSLTGSSSYGSPITHNTISASASISAGTMDEIYKYTHNLYMDIAPSLSKTDFLGPLAQGLSINPQNMPLYRIYELPTNSYLEYHFSASSPQYNMGNWQMYKSIVVDKDAAYGNTSVEYVPVMANVSYNTATQFNTATNFLPITACTDVVSTGYSLKFNIGDTAHSSMASNVGVFLPKIVNSYGKVITKVIDIPALSNTASKTVSFYLKKDTNTSISYVSLHAISVNSAYSNTSANNYQPTATLIANVSTIPTTYTQYSNTITFPSTTGNKLIFQQFLSGGPSNGAIYLDGITVT